MSSQTNQLLLGVNVDHSATLRQARYKEYPQHLLAEPNVLDFTLLCESAGADGITMHLREDARHVQAFDIRAVKESIQTRLNLEMACSQAMIQFALDLRPHSVCLVPENREEVTTEGGLDLVKHFDRVVEVVDAMNHCGIFTSLFIDADPLQINKAAELGAPWIELHTGAFSHAYCDGDWALEWQKLSDSAELAQSLNLVINAGHGINYHNIKQIRKLPHLNELNIGHSIVSRSVFVGIENAVKEMKNLMIRDS